MKYLVLGKLFSYLVGFSLFLITLELLLRLFGLYAQPQQAIKPLLEAKKNAVFILCVGDSMTAYGFEKSYPSQLQKLLDMQYGKNKFYVINFGIPGSSVIEVIEKARLVHKELRPEVVITMLGINDLVMPLSIFDTNLKSNFKIIYFAQWLIKTIQNSISPNPLIQLQNYAEYLPDPLAEYELYANALFTSGNYKEAYDQYLVISKDFPQDESVILRLVQTSILVESEKTALLFVNRAKELINDPRFFIAATAYALQKHHSAKNDGSINFSLIIQLLSEYLEKNKSDYFVRWLLARTYRTIGKNVEALKEYAQVYEQSNCNINYVGGMSKTANYLEFKENYNRSQAPCKLPSIKSVENKKEDLTEEIRQFSVSNTAIQGLQLWNEQVLAISKYHLIMHYPLLSSEPLFSIFPQNSKAISVLENKQNFELNMAKLGYDSLFVDRNSLLFGHGTDLGNSFLAETAFKKILLLYPKD